MSGQNTPNREAHTPRSDESPLAEKSQDSRLATRSGRSKWGRKWVIICALLITCFVVLALALGLGLGLGLKHGIPSRTGKPNVLVIMTDDQDVLLDSMSVMPNVNSMIGDQGVTYPNHYCTVAWCCPSRVNFLTGRAAHNTNVTSIYPPYGGWPKFFDEGLNENYLPVWLQKLGIRTYYIGKIMNGYSKGSIQIGQHPSSWTDSSMLLDPWTYSYYDSHWTNGYTQDIVPFKGTHTTDVTEQKALAMLDTAADSGDQFFMMVAPVAPHQAEGHAPPVPKAFKGIYDGAKAPRRANFNPDTPSGASYVRTQDKLTDKQIKVCDETHAGRLGNVAAVDAMVAKLINKLDDKGILNNTYIVYTTDNGFHIGNHRLPPGKRCPYEEDINIPLLMRGPGVAKGVNSTITNSHTDMAPTILQMLDVPLRDDFDGEPIAYSESSLQNSAKSELVNVEFWDAGNAPHGLRKHGQYYNATYKALRLKSGSQNLFYSTWCSGEREFYDMSTDYVQMNNRLGPDPKGEAAQYYGRSESELMTRLDALLMVTKSCKQDSCRLPWNVLFPSGNVTDLEVAMHPDYDGFFAEQPKVTFSACKPLQIIADEGPQHVIGFTGS